MKLDVKHTAKLANLTLTPEEIAKFEKQLEETLNFINQLNEVDTEGVKITYQVTGLENIAEEDKTKPSLSQKEALANATKTHKGFFVVDALLEEQL